MKLTDTCIPDILAIAAIMIAITLGLDFLMDIPPQNWSPYGENWHG